MSQPDTTRIVSCPNCRRPTPYSTGNAWRPFCSQRCREGDLGAWASEQFRLPAEAPLESSDVEAAQADPRAPSPRH